MTGLITHVALSISSPALSPVLFMSPWHALLVFGHPLNRFPGISILNVHLPWTQYIFFFSFLLILLLHFVFKLEDVSDHCRKIAVILPFHFCIL